jgi:hypothetical protein
MQKLPWSTLRQQSQPGWLATRSSPFACLHERRVEAPPGFEPGMEVLQASLALMIHARICKFPKEIEDLDAAECG